LSAFLGLTPTIRGVLENPLLGRRFPPEGSIVIVLDTGYEGFVGLPNAVFRALALDQLQAQTRTLVLADGRSLTTRGAYGRLTIPDVPVSLDGFVESSKELEEVHVGTSALARLSVLLDYCVGRIRLASCP
jgi:clan AA aspartic protease